MTTEDFKPKRLELVYNTHDDLNKLSEKDKSLQKEFLIDNLPAIENAIKKKLPKIELIDIYNLSIVIELEKTHYNDAIKRIIDIYSDEEQFDKCAELTKLITK